MSRHKDKDPGCRNCRASSVCLCGHLGGSHPTADYCKAQGCRCLRFRGRCMNHSKKEGD